MDEKNTQSRKWQLTINNPTEKGLTHEALKSIITNDNFKSLEYWAMCDEIGLEEKTPHTHVFIYCKNGVLFNRVKKLIPTAHIEFCKGTCQQNRDYIRKEGKYLNDPKTATNLKDTFEEFGEMPIERQGTRSDLQDMIDMISQGQSTADMIKSYPNFMLQIDKIERTRQIILEDKYKRTFRNMEVKYIYGTAGSGKTRGVMEQYGFENVYRITDYAHPFDGYLGQDVLVFEEFRSSLKIGDMLNYLDGYPISLPCRFQNKQACFTKVFIISNIPLDGQYVELQREQPETWKALLRRITNGVKQYDGNKVREYQSVGDYYLMKNLKPLENEKLPF